MISFYPRPYSLNTKTKLIANNIDAPRMYLLNMSSKEEPVSVAWLFCCRCSPDLLAFAFFGVFICIFSSFAVSDLCVMYPKILGVAVSHFFSKIIFHVHFVCYLQYLQMKWPLLDVQAGTLQSRQALKDARSPSPAHIVVSDLTEMFASFIVGRWNVLFLITDLVYHFLFC